MRRGVEQSGSSLGSMDKWAVQPETAERNLSNSVNPEMGIPSQALKLGEGVETRRQAPVEVG